MFFVRQHENIKQCVMFLISYALRSGENKLRFIRYVHRNKWRITNRKIQQRVTILFFASVDNPIQHIWAWTIFFFYNSDVNYLYHTLEPKSTNDLNITTQICFLECVTKHPGKKKEKKKRVKLIIQREKVNISCAV